MGFEQMIAPGQVYREVYPPHLAWRVVRVVQKGLDVPHAAIQRLDDRNTIKLISCRALLDPRRYCAADAIR
jgi:hypothetical protein